MLVKRIEAFTLIALVAFATTATALPTFARHEGISCLSCHASKGLHTSDLVTPQITATPYSSYVAPLLEDGIKAGITVVPESSGRFLEQAAGNDLPENSEKVRGVFLTPKEDEGRNLSGLTGYLGWNAYSASIGLFNKASAPQSEKYSDPSFWYRFAFAPRLGEGFGVTMAIFGEVSQAGTVDNNRTRMDSIAEPESFGLDAQVNGQIGSVNLDFKTMYLNVGENSRFKGENGLLSEVTDGFSATAKIGVERVFGLSAAYRTYKGKIGETEANENIASVGAWLNINESVTMESKYTNFGADDNFVTYDSLFSLLFMANF